MNDATKQAYLDKMSAQLREWGAKVDVVKAKLAQGTADIRIDYHKQIESWHEQELAFKHKMTELGAVGADGFEVMKTAAQKSWNEVTSFVDNLESKINEKLK